MKVNKLRELVRRVVAPAPTSIYSGDYRSFDEARSTEQDVGYESSAGIVEHYITGYRQIAAIANNRHCEPNMFRRLVPIMAALSLCSDLQRVVDIGGSYGEYYHRLRWLNPQFDPTWDIVETDTVCAIAQSLGANERKRYVPSIATLEPGRVDLVIVSGTLQYLPDPLATMRSIFAIGSPLLVFSRLPIVAKLSNHRVVIQRPKLMEASLPMWFFSPAIFDEMAQFGSVLFDFTIPEDVIDYEGKSFPMSGCVIKREINDPRS